LKSIVFSDFSALLILVVVADL